MHAASKGTEDVNGKKPTVEDGKRRSTRTTDNKSIQEKAEERAKEKNLEVLKGLGSKTFSNSIIFSKLNDMELIKCIVDHNYYLGSSINEVKNNISMIRALEQEKAAKFISSLESILVKKQKESKNVDKENDNKQGAKCDGKDKAGWKAGE